MDWINDTAGPLLEAFAAPMVIVAFITMLAKRVAQREDPAVVIQRQYQAVSDQLEKQHERADKQDDRINQQGNKIEELSNAVYSTKRDLRYVVDHTLDLEHHIDTHGVPPYPRNNRVDHIIGYIEKGNAQ